MEGSSLLAFWSPDIIHLSLTCKLHSEPEMKAPMLSAPPVAKIPEGVGALKPFIYQTHADLLQPPDNSQHLKTLAGHLC